MNRKSLLTAAAAFVLVGGAASAQTTSTPAAPATPAQPAAKTPGAPATAATPATPAATASAAPVRASGDIIETAKASGQFGTFLKAVEATNLTQVLKNNKGLTVFAPTDAAFASMPPGELERLMQPANRAQLQKVMTYHIINAQVDSSKIDGAKGPVPTVAGANVELDGSGEALKVNDATILQADVKPTNGTIHVIDKVLLPPGSATAATAPAPGAGASASASVGASASAVPSPSATAATGASTNTGAQASSSSPGSATASEGDDQ